MKYICRHFTHQGGIGINLNSDVLTRMIRETWIPVSVFSPR